MSFTDMNAAKRAESAVCRCWGGGVGVGGGWGDQPAYLLSARLCARPRTCEPAFWEEPDANGNRYRPRHPVCFVHAAIYNILLSWSGAFWGFGAIFCFV